jgi:hypothetical protein
MLQLDYIKISEVSMKPLEPGCLAMVISGEYTGTVVQVLCRLPTDSKCKWYARSKGHVFTSDSISNNDNNWLIDGVPGLTMYGCIPEVCTVSHGDLVGSAVFYGRYLMRIDGFDPEEHQTKTRDLLLQE